MSEHELPEELKALLGFLAPQDQETKKMMLRDVDNRLLDFSESLTDEQLTIILVFLGKGGMVPHDEFIGGIGQLCGFLISEKTRRNRNKLSTEALVDG